MEEFDRVLLAYFGCLLPRTGQTVSVFWGAPLDGGADRSANIGDEMGVVFVENLDVSAGSLDLLADAVWDLIYVILRTINCSFRTSRSRSVDNQ